MIVAGTIYLDLVLCNFHWFAMHIPIYSILWKWSDVINRPKRPYKFAYLMVNKKNTINCCTFFNICFDYDLKKTKRYWISWQLLLSMCVLYYILILLWLEDLYYRIYFCWEFLFLPSKSTICIRYSMSKHVNAYNIHTKCIWGSVSKDQF